MHDARVPGEAHGQPFAERERLRRPHAHRRAGVVDRGGLLPGAVAAGERHRADVLHALGQRDRRLGPLDWHLPLLPGDVPVKLVVVVEEAQRLGDAVADDDRADRVPGVGHPHLELAVVPFATALVAQRRTRLIGHRIDRQTQRVVELLRRDVLDRNRAVQAVPAAREPGPDGLDDLDAAVAIDGHAGLERRDRERALSVRGRHHGKETRRERQRDEQGFARHGAARSSHFSPPPSSTAGTAASSPLSSWKYSRRRKPNSDATMFDGTRWMAVLRSRTTAL